MNKQNTNSILKVIRYILIPSILLLLISTGILFLFFYYFQDKFIPFTHVTSIEITAQTRSQAEIEIQDKIDIIELNGIEYQYEGNSIHITPTVVSPFDKDASYRLVYFDIENSLKQAFNKGHEGNYIEKVISIIQGFTKGHKIDMAYDLNKTELIDILQSRFAQYEKVPQDATFIVDDKNEVTVKEEQGGFTFDYEKAVQETQDILSNLSLKPVVLDLKITQPEIFKNDINTAVNQAKKILEKETITLKYNNKEWEVTQNQFKDWLTLDKATVTLRNDLPESPRVLHAAYDQDNEKKFTWLSFHEEKVSEYLETIALEINIEPQDAKFEIKNNRVTEFQESLSGKKLDINKTVTKLNVEIIDQDNKESLLVVETVTPKKQIKDANDLGIKEIIGIGSSNFRGSPKNRVHNIRVGARAVNGSIIAPEEEFSLIKILGHIGESSGYKPELVIKGNETIPEYGGGLCQIGTTNFRAAVNTGLLITERRNHSYRVSYYEPAGTDATIYSPRPDLRFINDTDHHILIQTKIKGTQLIFEFWGTHDGRKVENTDPEIYNIKKPPPTKIVKTADLEPGEKKCTEHAHNGASAKFDTTITYADGETRDQTFRSHYIPWQEVCLLGVEPEELEENIDTESDEEDNKDESDPKERTEELKKGFSD